MNKLTALAVALLVLAAIVAEHERRVDAAHIEALQQVIQVHHFPALHHDCKIPKGAQHSIASAPFHADRMR